MLQTIKEKIISQHNTGLNCEFEVKGETITIRTVGDVTIIDAGKLEPFKGQLKRLLKDQIELRIVNEKSIIFPKNWEYFTFDDRMYFKKGFKYYGIEDPIDNEPFIKIY